MSTLIASLYATITGDSSGLKKALGGAKTDLQNTAKQMDATGAASMKAGAKMALMGGAVGAVAGAAGLLISGLKAAVAAASEAEVMQSKLNAVLESTEYAAGLSADEINNMASDLSHLTAIDDEAIVGMEALLLTFTKIGKDVFPEASMAVLNISKALGSDLSSAAIQVGKALQDPILGMTALRRVGVNFDAASKEIVKSMIEMGDVAGAQRFILDELNTEFGGQAVAQAMTYAGSIDAIKISWENLGEAIATGGMGSGGSQFNWVTNLNLGISDTIDMMTELLFTQGLVTGDMSNYNRVLAYGTDAVNENTQSHQQQYGAFLKTQQAAEKLADVNLSLAKVEDKAGLSAGFLGKNVDGVAVSVNAADVSMTSFTDILKLAGNDIEKVQFAQMLWGDQIDVTNKTLLEQERATLVAKLMFEEMDDATRDMISSDLELVDAKLEVIGIVTELGSQFHQLGESMQNVTPSMDDMFNSMDRDLGSPIKAFMDDLKYWEAGGGEIQQQFEAVKQAFLDNKITAPEAEAWIGEIALAHETTMVEAGLETTKEAQANVKDIFDTTSTEAKKMLDGFDSEIATFTSQERQITFRIVVTGDTWIVNMLGGGAGLGSPGRGGGGGGGGGGGNRGGIPYEAQGGPVWANAPYIVGEQGPEMFVPNTSGRIVPNNQLGGMGGDTINIYNNSTGAAALTMAIIQQSHRARLSRSMGG